LWFGEPGTDPLQHQKRWWTPDPGFDAEVRHRFEPDFRRAVRGELEAWKAAPEGRLAFIVLLDQLARNMYRGTPTAYQHDDLALRASLEGQDLSQDQLLGPIERWFFYMPMMHAEDPAIQARSVAAFQRLADGSPPAVAPALRTARDFAMQHQDTIRRFGRFPHRNAILGRTSTLGELDFIAETPR
jgi:uncharacterized protein (DUF924 family)